MHKYQVEKHSREIALECVLHINHNHPAYISRRDTHLSLSLCIRHYILRTKRFQSGYSFFVWGLFDLKSFSEWLNNTTRKPLRNSIEMCISIPCVYFNTHRHADFSKSEFRIACNWDTPLFLTPHSLQYTNTADFRLLDVWITMCRTSALHSHYRCLSQLCIWLNKCGWKAGHSILVYALGSLNRDAFGEFLDGNYAKTFNYSWDNKNKLYLANHSNYTSFNYSFWQIQT